MCVLVTPSNESVHGCSEKEIQQLFDSDKFGSDSRIDVDDLETMLTVDHLVFTNYFVILKFWLQSSNFGVNWWH